MKALGVSFGRKMQSCEVLVKQALKQLEARGYETQFIRMSELDIKYCTGCLACVIGQLGGGKGGCVLKDDLPILQEAIFEADAVIFAAPIYVWAPSGLFKTVCDRFGPAADLAFRTHARQVGEAMGKSEEELVDKRAFKKRAAAYITAGGAKTKNWTSFGLASMYEVGSMGLNVVDAVNVYNIMASEHIISNKEVMDRMTAVGNHLADALETEGGLDKWYGDEGVCPVCHMDLLTILPEGNKVECPVCGIEGTLTVDDGKIHTHFSAEQQARSRLYFAGKEEHKNEIGYAAMHQEKIPNLQERLKDYL